MSYAGERLPYPGLRSFSREETDLFFGREGCVDDMVNRLAATRFLAVLGASGSGKSSLVKTGLLDALELGFLSEAGPRWAMAIFAPGEAPLHNLSRALLKTIEADPDERDVQLQRGFLARGPRSVVEWCREGNLPEGKNLLILVDQFEELFRYGRYSEREEAEAFVALLLESARAPLGEARIYVAITMRSEYLGEAALIDGLADAINNGLYLTPRMTRDQVREAVTGPAAVEDFEIEPALVNRLLNDLTYFAPWEESDKDKDGSHQRERLGRRADQLPLMQHLLNRLWSIAAERGDRPIRLVLKDYTDLGGLKGALGAHGREILATLTPKGRAVAGSVFRALVAGSSLSQAVRNPTRFRELVEIAGDEEGVRNVVETFRAPGVNFLMPPPPVPILPDTFIDISHESLIRQWDQFSEWLGKEIESSEAWWRLVDAAERYEKGEANLSSGLALASLAHWWDVEHPTAAWAKRYGGDFAKAKTFLEQSRVAEKKAKAAEAAEQLQKSRGRLRALAALVIICIITPLTAFAGYQAYRASQQAKAAQENEALAIEQQQIAEQAAREADLQKQAAERAAAEADAERQNAQDAAEVAAKARVLAIHESERAHDAEVAARDAEGVALAARDDAQQANARQAQTLRQIQLERIANRAEAYQQSGLWESASALLATFWRDLVETGGEIHEELLEPPIRAAISRQTLAEYSVIPGFLSYSGLDGSSINAGRFRVYATSETTGDRRETTVSIMDVVTAGTVGAFTLPAGKDATLHSGLLASPDGARAVVLTTDNEFAIWRREWQAPVLISAPAWMGDEDADITINLAPVNTDDKFAILVNKGDTPEEVIVLDPDAKSIVYQAAITGIASSLKIGTVNAANLIGTSGDRLLLSVSYGEGDDTGVRVASMSLIPSKGKGQGSATPIDLAGIVGDPELSMDDGDDFPAQLTPDGQMLLAVTCSGYCYGDAARKLVAVDALTSELLWTEELPPNMEFTENAARVLNDDGGAPYTTIIDHSGIAIIFEFGRDRGSVRSRDSRVTPWIGTKTYDGQGFYVTLESRSAFNAGAGTDGIAEGYLANFIVPESRERLQTEDGRQIYVDENSVAIRQAGDDIWIAGVSYVGDLLVYKRAGGGEIALDTSFPSLQIGLSKCIAGIAFGGDGRSLLIRRKSDGALRYIAADAGKHQMDWFKPAAADADRSVQQMEPVDSDAETDSCDTSVDGDGDDLGRTMIVPADPDGRIFAVLDGRHDVWWVRLADSAASNAGSTITSLVLEDLSFLRKGVTSIAGDPARHRIAALSPRALEIISAGGSGRSTRVQIRSEPRAAVFHNDGGLAVSFAGGSLQWFAEQNGAWASQREVSAPSPDKLQLVASDTRVGILDDWDSLVMIERSSEGTSSAYSRLPADPIAIALFPDGQKILSIEWVTDSASIMSLNTVPGPDETASSARLVVMRSYQDRVHDSNIESLAVAQQAGAPAPDAVSVENCGVEVAMHLSRLEHRILGDSASSMTPVAPACVAGSSAERLFEVIDALADRIESSGTDGILEDENFSVLLQTAAAKDAVALRILGAVLAEMSLEHRDADAAAITADAVRFGTGLPVAYLKEVAAGAAIDPAVLDAASAYTTFEPTALQLLAHSHERDINNLQSLSEALFEFSVAERLYHQSDRLTEAEFAGQRRVQLARILPHENVLGVWDKLQAWQPKADAMPETAEIADVPADAAERTLADIDNAGRIDWLPDSLLLTDLRTGLEQAYLRGLAESDPTGATDRLLQSREGTGWSLDTLKEYLDLADAITAVGQGSAAPTEEQHTAMAASRLRLAAEVLRTIAAANPDHIHNDATLADLYKHAAEVFADAAKRTPEDLVASEIEGIDLSLADYDYSTLPAVDAGDDVAIAEEVLGSTARVAGAVARVGIDAPAWNRRRGDALFWQGVLTNDHDPSRASEIFGQSAEVLSRLIDEDSDNVDLRFRYAEALRWQGTSMQAGTDRAEIERSATAQYRQLWDDRVILDGDMLSKVGTGYGRALTNLGQTIREINVADLYSEQTVEDSAPWLFEVLALAADKQDVIDTLADRGLFTRDTDFAGGLNQMQTYGWAIGFVSGAASFERGSEHVTECDLRASEPYDAGRRAPPSDVGSLTAEGRGELEALCREAHVADAGDARSTFQLASVISYEKTRNNEFMPLARQAAESGVSAAYVLLGNTLYNADDDRNGQVYLAAAQQVIVEAFPVLYPAIKGFAEGDRDRAGLAWLVERAAALGVPEAHVALAEAAGDDETRRFEYLLAGRLWDEAGNASAAERARDAAAKLNIEDAVSTDVDARVSAWTPESRVAIPDDVANI